LFLLRVLLPFAALLLIGLGIAYVTTRDRKYLRYLFLAIQIEVLLIVGFGLIYVLERAFLL
jgi:hypothetical protein